MNVYLENFIEKLNAENTGQKQFVEAATEVMKSFELFIEKHAEYCENGFFENLDKPQNIVEFDVDWKDDAGNTQTNRCWRVQFNNKLGPFKGGLRFHPTVNLSILKALAFEQIFKNSLTTLPLGGAKGGSNFDPKGKSEAEIKCFCESFMDGLAPHIGADVDVPAGDIGVGAREITYMYNRYREVTGKNDCALTGKPIELGGSLARKEATGFGLIYFVNEFLSAKKNTLEGKKVLISGSGNVAIYAAQKAIELGAKVLTMSDSNGFVYDEDGIDLDLVKQIKEVERVRISEYSARKNSAKYFAGEKPWSVASDIALPCATQNEISLADAQTLVKNGIQIIAEGANLPTCKDAVEFLKDKNVAFLPAKAANAGGVAVSGLEMQQAKLGQKWTFDQVDAKLKAIMSNIFENLANTSAEYSLGQDYQSAANIAALKRLL